MKSALLKDRAALGHVWLRARFDPKVPLPYTESHTIPGRRADLLIRLLLQNAGQLSKAKRLQFAELTDAEVAAMEQAVQAAMASPPSLTPSEPG